MSTNTVSINVNHLRAALVCAAKDDVRYYLCGVLVDFRADDIRIVGTDGHHLVCLRSEYVDGDDRPKPCQIIIPRAALEGIKPCKGLELAVLTFDAENPMAQCKLEPLAKGGITFTPVDGRFPDYARTLPNEPPQHAPAWFDARYVADFKKVADIVAGAKAGAQLPQAQIWQCGECAAPVTLAGHPEFFGVLMPMRMNSECVLPDWVKPQAAAETKPRKLRKAA